MIYHSKFIQKKKCFIKILPNKIASFLIILAMIVIKWRAITKSFNHK
ncbi:hypothetical protein EJK48_1208 [Moraxella catarrhalis]|uniref:Uncharacterized protein n=1 Tax=Moraxella catarrhalis TaxID=480 RepID=A0A3S9QFU4_MORCA|nr:hypothetical protein EJK53_1207 [Moraxella catarrhalis]AZQ94536.1 hypothetical protein EJK48_1208 [Moraxella catarrhalis]RUO12353.1 hypothetical protein EJK49_0324 [Moraxella catarrhalis]